MASEALDAAMEAAKYRGVLEKRGTNAIARDAVAAYLDSLLRDIPEEAVEAAAKRLSDVTPMDFATAWNFLHPPHGALGPFLESLRTNLDSGDTVRKGGG